MGLVQEESIKSSIVTYIGYGIGAINALFLYTHFLLDTQKGLIDSIQVLVITFVTIGSLGVAESIFKFLPYYKVHQKNNENDLLAKTLLIGGAAISLTYFLSFLFKEQIYNSFRESPLLVEYLHLVPIFIYGYFVFYIFYAFNIGHHNISYTAIIQEIFIRVYNTFALLLYIFKVVSFENLIIVLSFQYWIAAFLLAYKLYKQDLFYLRIRTSRVTSRLFKKMVSYSLYFWLGVSLAKIAGVIDKFVLMDLKGLEQVAYFTLAEYLITILLVPQKAIQNVLLPVISEAWRANDKAKIKSMYIKGANNMVWAGGIIFILIIASINNIFALFPPTYSIGKEVFIILGLAKLIDFATSVNGHILLYSKKYYKTELGFGIILNILLIPITYSLVKSFGILGSAYAQVICFTIINFSRLAYLKWKEGLNPFDGNIKLFLLIATAIAISLAFNLYSPIRFDKSYVENALTIASKTAVITPFLALLIYKLNLSNDFHNLMDNALKKLNSIFYK